ncbi:MAG: flagellar hook-basal body complex protein FliE [Alphaproteobacteria bacterium]|nr:flagellar hook-basal body complex protein FliE [Alphaproteobacteria bacterium]
MNITASSASNAYALAARIAQAQDTHPLSEDSSEGFGNILQNTLNSVKEMGARTDRVVTDVINEKADLVQVVTAVAETELAMETLVSVRNRVISAYEEIMRMPI